MPMKWKIAFVIYLFTVIATSIGIFVGHTMGSEVRCEQAQIDKVE